MIPPDSLYPYFSGEVDNGEGAYTIHLRSHFTWDFFMMSDVDRIKRTKEYRSIRTSLIDQLERSGNDLPHFLNMVEDYMSMYVTKELCKADIADRGISVTSIGSTGQLVTKKNDSADLLLKTNQQMIKLLDMLGIKPDAGLGAEDEEM